MSRIIAISRMKAKNNRQRMRRAKAAYIAYLKVTGEEESVEVILICDLIADLLHLLTDLGEDDASHVAALAARHFRDERKYNG